MISHFSMINCRMMIVQIMRIAEKLLEKINIEAINRYTIYLLVVLLWAPHGAKECMNEACSGPNFVAPMIFTFLAPGWVMDMSSHGWIMQLVFAPPMFALIYALFALARVKGRFGKLFSVYVIRWTIMWCGILLYYNFVFWYGPLREYVFPLFTF